MRLIHTQIPLNRWIWRVAAGLACWLTIGASAALGQMDLDAVLFGPSNARAAWEQRVLSRSGAPSMIAPGLGYAPQAAQPGRAWIPRAGWNPAPWATASTSNLVQANSGAGAAAGQTPARLTGFRAPGYPWTAQSGTQTNIAPAPDPVAIGSGQTSISEPVEPIPSPGVGTETAFAPPGWAMGDEAGCGPAGCATCALAGVGCEPEIVPGCGGGCSWGYGPGWHPGWWLLRRSSLWAGVHGFKGPLDFGRNGNFGLHEGVDLGVPLGGPFGVGVQVGFQALHSNFEGDQTLGALRTADRNQIFFTGGLFRRAVCAGFQWGVVVDVLHDSYYDVIDLTQLRTELAWVFPSGWELGYWGAYGTSNDNLILPNQQILFQAEPTDQFLFYVRRYLPEGGEGRFWVGFSSAGDGLLGGELNVPLGRCWAIENRLGYLIARQGPNDPNHPGQAEESWGLSMHLVWYPGRPARAQQFDPFRPLIPVADNATFMTDWQP